jgi:hypothetical protein
MIKLNKLSREALRRSAAKAEASRDDAMAAGTEDGFKGAVDDWWYAFLYHVAVDDHAAAQQVARRLVEDAKYALFGDWRVGYAGWDEKAGKDITWDHALAKKHFYWVDTFRRAVAAAAYLGDWDAAADVAAYTEGAELPTWSANICHVATADSREFYVEFAKLLRRGRVDVTAKSPFPSKLPPPRAKLLRACLLALADRDAVATTAALAAYVTYYATRERDREYLPDLICVDGTILYHFAGKQFGAEPELDPKHLPLIARVPPPAPASKAPSRRRPKRGAGA